MSAPSEKLSVARKALMWWFEWPANPYVCISAVVDFSDSRAYLDRLNSGSSAPVTIQHLLLAIIAQVFKEFPDANARIIGSKIRHLDHVSVAMPVSMEGFASGERPDLAMAVLEHIEGRSLRQITEACRQTVSAERSGQNQHPIVRALTGIIERTPYPVLARGLSLINGLRRAPVVAEQLHRLLNISTALTNPGAAFSRVDGAFLRAISVAIPQRLFHIGTIWGISAVQDEVIPVDGEPQVRPVLPVILVFDHRLFDGIVAGRILVRFAEMVRAPESAFGKDGEIVR